MSGEAQQVETQQVETKQVETTEDNVRQVNLLDVEINSENVALNVMVALLNKPLVTWHNCHVLKLHSIIKLQSIFKSLLHF